MDDNRCKCFAESPVSTFDNEEQVLGKVLENEAAYIGKKLSTNNMVPGTLCRVPEHAAFYKDVLQADQQVLNVVSYGYVFPFENEPPVDTTTKNNQSCLKNLDFALHELHRLEKLQCIKRVQDGDSCVNMPLSVVFFLISSTRVRAEENRELRRSDTRATPTTRPLPALSLASL